MLSRLGAGDWLSLVVEFLEESRTRAISQKHNPNRGSGSSSFGVGQAII